MKGLLLKDWYAFKSYCRATLFIVILFAIIGGIVEENFFFVFPVIALHKLVSLQPGESLQRLPLLLCKNFSLTRN